MDVHQSLMDAAGKKRRDGMKYIDFLLQLDVMERRATVLGNLNYQVENGGFLQWRDNGYDVQPQFIYDAIDAVGTDLSKEVRRLVQEALAVDMSNQYDSDAQAEISDKLDGLDLAYYKINKTFLEECEAYFSKE